MKSVKAPQNIFLREKLMKELSCQICRELMNLPVTTPCAHNFCKACLEVKFVRITLMSERSKNGRTLRAKRNVMTCPCCQTDISDFLQDPQVNGEVNDLVEKLRMKEEEPTKEEVEEDTPESSSGGGNTDDPKEEEEEEEEDEEEEEENEAEPPSKKMKRDTDAVVVATATVLTN